MYNSISNLCTTTPKMVGHNQLDFSQILIFKKSINSSEKSKAYICYSIRKAPWYMHSFSKLHINCNYKNC